MKAPEVNVKLLTGTAKAPSRTRPHDAALDLSIDESLDLAAGERRKIGTGIAISLPPGWCGLVLSRSGLPLNHGIVLMNAPGLIDPSYRGEIALIVQNTASEPYRFERGDRVAQLLVVPFAEPIIREVDDLPPSTDSRGEDGFGSSGR